jgi:hypothetical protein
VTPRGSRRRRRQWLLVAVAASSLLMAPVSIQAQAPGGSESQAVMVRADIDAYETKILSRDRSYSPQARRQASERLERLRDRAGTVTAAELELELARISALADNGHTAAAAGSRSRRYNRVEIRLAPFGRDFHVMRAVRGHEDLLGARLVSIDGVGMARLLTEARSLSGGASEFRDRYAPFLFESPDLLCALRIARRCASAIYRFRTTGGRIVSRELTAEGPRPDRSTAGAARWLAPELLPDEHGRWSTALSLEAAPWSIQSPGEPFRWREDAELRAIVLSLRQTSNVGTASIADFLTRVESEITARRPHNLVIDLRFNPGGDLTTTRDFMQRAPGLVSGRVFVLTSPWTFSAAISSVGYLKQAGGRRVLIVGESAGDRLEFFAEGWPIPLPHSGAVFNFARDRHDYRTGCRGKPDCYRVVIEHPIAIRSLRPDISAPWEIGDYLGGRDTAMEAIAAEIRRESRSGLRTSF